jgi:hypothetical protein
MKCPSLSGRSTLTYEVKDGLLTITGNSGRGLFKPTPVSMKAVDDLLTTCEWITAATLHELFKGTSVNTAGFVLAALKDLGAVEPLPENSRRFRRRSQV